MSFILGLIAIGFGTVLVVYREACADAVGEPMWAQKLGGMQMIMVGSGVLMWFWGLATMTGTTDILFSPLVSFLPGLKKAPPVQGF